MTTIAYRYAETAPCYGETRPYDALTADDRAWWDAILARLQAVADADLDADTRARVIAAGASTSDLEACVAAQERALSEAQARALPEWLYERITRVYRGRGDSACGDDLRAGSVPPTTESDLDTGTLLAHVGLGDGLGDGEETTWLLGEYETDGPAVVALARESVIAGYLDRAREAARLAAEGTA